jgi:hypothetical protein
VAVGALLLTIGPPTAGAATRPATASVVAGFFFESIGWA